MLRIERLILENFKSFGGVVDVPLEPGVSVIVGANGSGKSNLLDALRWVLGETDISSLRAPRLSDLAFRGTPGEPGATGFRVTAEITAADGERIDATRGYDPAGGQYFEVGDRVLSAEAYVPELRAHGVPVPLFTAIRQGDVGRLLWYHPEERTELLMQSKPGRRPEVPPRSDVSARARADLLTAVAPNREDPRLRTILDMLGLPHPDNPGHGARPQEGTPNGMQGGMHEAARGGARGDDLLTRFLALHERTEARLDDFFRTLVPGGEARLPLVEPRDAGRLPGVGVSVRFPGKPAVGLDGLSGGQQAILGLALALASFLETPSPALVLDEVEPAMDDSLVRRVSRLLDDIGHMRQTIVVSHQRIMRFSARHVMHIERADGASGIGLRYDPRAFRSPGASGS